MGIKASFFGRVPLHPSAATCSFLAIAALFSVLAPTPLAAGEDRQSLAPDEDHEVVLHNPDMGWVLYENFPLDPRPRGSGTMNVLPMAAFDGCDHVAVMFAWSDVEISPGNFDWSRIDAACDHWLARGKSLHLRMSTEPLYGWSALHPPGGLGIPDWLLAQIPDEQKVRRTYGEQFGWHVDARNPIYQERLRSFLAATHRHFSGRLTPALIDLRGFGRWGEWHSGFPYPSLLERREALAAILQIWTTAFPDRSLALSYSHDPDGPPALHHGPTHQFAEESTLSYQEFLHFSAFDLALEHPAITLRRDGAGGAVSSNERKLAAHAYRDLRRAPFMSEFVDSYSQMSRAGGKYLEWVIDDALSLHPNYISLLGYSGRDAQRFMLERPDLLGRGLRGMGYRLVPIQIDSPKILTPNAPFTLKMQWTNRAAGRALHDFILKIHLAEPGSATPIATIEAGPLPTSTWLQGDTHSLEVEAIFPSIHAAGTMQLLISLHHPISGTAIQLPLTTRTHDGLHKISEVGIGP
jgi:hypothetical protein